MSRTEQITKLIKSLSNNTPDVEGAAVIDNDGLMIASALPADVEDDRVDGVRVGHDTFERGLAAGRLGAGHVPPRE